MALKSYKPTSPARRGLVLVDRSSLYKGKPLKALTEGKSKTGGRNNKGHVTSRGIGGGHKQKYRVIDFKRRKWDMPATVERLEYDPNRSAFIALVKYEDGEQAYIIAPQRLAVGDTIVAGEKTDVKPGNAMLLSQMPVGTICHNIEMKPNKGGQIARSAGTYVRATLHPRHLHGHGWRGFKPRQLEHHACQGRPQSLARHSPANPRCCKEPSRSPAWWW
jgi:large subunit ribosomal protein L2